MLEATIEPPAAFDPLKASLLGKFVAAAYTMYHAEPSNLMPLASADLPSGYRLLASLRMQDFVLSSTGPVFYGFLAKSTSDESEFVLAIRGTSNWTEWWDDANAGSATPFRVPGCGSVGTGFARIYDTLELVDYTASPMMAAQPSLRQPGGFAAQVRTLVARHLPPVSPMAAATALPVVSVVGHSLGAALATMYALENAKTERLRNPLLCTFASPRVGDADFVAAVNALHLRSWRIVNGPDLVPHLPPEFLGFSHVDAVQPVSSTGKVKSTIECWHALSTYLSLIDATAQPGTGCRLDAEATAGLAQLPGLRRAPSVRSGVPSAAFAKTASTVAGATPVAKGDASEVSVAPQRPLLLPITDQDGSAGYVNVSDITHIGVAPARPDGTETGGRITFRNRAVLDVREPPDVLANALRTSNYAIFGSIYPPSDWMRSQATRSDAQSSDPSPVDWLSSIRESERAFPISRPEDGDVAAGRRGGIAADVGQDAGRPGGIAADTAPLAAAVAAAAIPAGWVLYVKRLRQERRAGEGFDRTVGTYTVFHDRTPTAIAGNTVERQGPGNNGLAGKVSHTCIKSGTYPIVMHASAKYGTRTFEVDGTHPRPALAVGDTGQRVGILIHPADEYGSTIGCINLAGHLVDANSNIVLPDSVARVMAVIADLGDSEPGGLPAASDAVIPSAHLVIEDF